MPAYSLDVNRRGQHFVPGTRVKHKGAVAIVFKWKATDEGRLLSFDLEVDGDTYASVVLPITPYFPGDVIMVMCNSELMVLGVSVIHEIKPYSWRRL